MYYRLCSGLNDVGVLVPKNENVKKFITNPKKDYYKSIFYYNEKQKSQAEQLVGNRKRGISGIEDVVTDRLVFDFDSEGNIENAKNDTIELCHRLIENGIAVDDLQISFSGKKGFSVDYQCDTFLSPKELRNIATNLAGDLSTFDVKIYNPSRIIRLPLTLHQDTLLYKLPLSFEELQNVSINQMKLWAKDTSDITIDNLWKPKPLPEKIKVLKDKGVIELVEKSVNSEVFKDISQIDWSARLPFLSPAKFVLHSGFFGSGNRNEALMILASTFKAVGFGKKDTYRLLKSAAERQSEISGQERFSDKEIWNNILGTVYSIAWKGGQYSPADNALLASIESQLPIHVRRTKSNDITELSDGFSEFVKYIENIDNNTIKFGIPSLDKKLKVQVGHLVGILAPPGLGKTSFLLTILNNSSLDGVNSMFFSYDMHYAAVMQKMIQRETGYTSDKIEEIVNSKASDETRHIYELLQKNYGNVSFCFKSGQSIADMKKTIIDREIVLGKEIKFIGVDYSELVLSQFSDPTQRSAEVIQGLREIATDMNKCIVVLLQPNKANSKPNEPLLGYGAAKGSSTISQALTSMITAHRPGYSSTNPEGDKFFSINVVKNRMGPLFNLDFSWDGLTGRIGDLDEYERSRLADLREALKEQKAKEDEW
jgi:replicative DNA helicase